jgi:hypothetical protein
MISPMEIIDFQGSNKFEPFDSELVWYLKIPLVTTNASIVHDRKWVGFDSPLFLPTINNAYEVKNG